MNFYLIAIVIAAMFSAERILVTLTARHPRGRAFLRGHIICHPNAISIMRIPMGVVAISLWSLGYPVAGIYWFAFWMISDLTDGTIARYCDLITESGKWLDPLSDKALYFPGLLFFAWHGVLSWPWVLALIVIDTMGQSSRLLVKKKAANVFGKSKTALITLLLIFAALHQLSIETGSVNIFTGANFPDFLGYLTVSCVLLAFLSVYCKIIPDIWYANTLSLANFSCGAVAVYYVWLGHPLFSFILVFIGQFFDLFDGRLARKYGSTRHGPVFDDIADGTSFGLAVAFIVYYQFDQSLAALLISVFYFLAVVYRLVRFLRHQGRLQPGIFEGVPSPAGALWVGSAALLFHAQPWLGLSLVVAGSLLMVSHLRYRHFALKIWRETPNILKVTVCLLVLLFVSRTLADQDYRLAFKVSAFVVACLYLVLGNEDVVHLLLRITGKKEKREGNENEQ